MHFACLGSVLKVVILSSVNSPAVPPQATNVCTSPCPPSKIVPVMYRVFLWLPFELLFEQELVF